MCIRDRLKGGGMSADAYHMTAPHPEGLGAYLVMKNCLEDAGVTTDEVDHILSLIHI